MKKKVKIRGRCFVCLLLTGAAIGIVLPNLVISSYGRYTSDRLDATPQVYCAILLGTSKYLPGNRKNLYYKYRIEAAKRLYDSGGCKKIIVSGDNETMQYNEPRTMRKDLMKAGVPQEDIICDYAGFRTLDSIIRFKKVFGRTKGVVVSQKFHNERAIYIARSYGIELYGYNALGVGLRSGLRTRLREVLSRVMCVLDVELLHTGPRFLGKQIKV
ncbi:YdcF family protein [Desulfobulbus sp. US1]|nr:YdcF family protein [Desulfobulbus sp. US4]MCW5204355.1 YdcF family protein [Desulfobulbus sp. N2]MCW5207972.1 YdcF family protein [Desulfobulbus sp. US2]MCW5209265.1 YdcF family protein [Desulfobulbus sp. US1]WLE95733.1 MAG: ElyC/SanA/YdcF family protein [Candidatus Electrothrix communis]